MTALIAQHSIWFCLFCFRYVRLFVNLLAFLRLRVILPVKTQQRKLSSKDVTVIIPTLNGYGIEETLASILATEPFLVYLVTVDANFEKARTVVEEIKAGHLITVLSIRYPNKRRQMVWAIPNVETKVIVFADDDVIWPSTLLPYMLSPLESSRYGAVGTNQGLKRRGRAQAKPPTSCQAIQQVSQASKFAEEAEESGGLCRRRK